MNDLIFLDNGATSYPKPEEVYQFMDHFYRNFGVNPGRSGYDLCMETGELVEETRAMMMRFFNGTDPDRLCFSYNSTDALNLVIFGLLKEGDHAISTTLEHNSVLRPLYHLDKFNGVEVDYIPFDSKGFVDPDDFVKKFKKNTKLVIVNHASNVIGTIQPIKDIGKYCRERDIAFKYIPFILASQQFCSGFLSITDPNSILVRACNTARIEKISGSVYIKFTLKSFFVKSKVHPAVRERGPFLSHI